MLVVIINLIYVNEDMRKLSDPVKISLATILGQGPTKYFIHVHMSVRGHLSCSTPFKYSSGSCAAGFSYFGTRVHSWCSRYESSIFHLAFSKVPPASIANGTST